MRDTTQFELVGGACVPVSLFLCLGRVGWWLLGSIGVVGSVVFAGNITIKGHAKANHSAQQQEAKRGSWLVA